MSLKTRLAGLATNLLFKDRADHELDEEQRSYVEMAADNSAAPALLKKQRDARLSSSSEVSIRSKSS